MSIESDVNSEAFWYEVKSMNKSVLRLIELTKSLDDQPRLAGTMIALAARIARSVGKLSKEESIKIFERAWHSKYE